MAESATPIVEIKGVSKVFRLQDQTIHALADANLSINKGEFICLIGASGCGKSTLLRIMAGFDQPSSGEALMWGRPIAGPDPSRGMVFQDYALFPWLSVRANIGFVDAFLLQGPAVPIGIGAWLGTIMLLNVWGLIWPNQKKVLGLVQADDAAKAKAARIAFLASRTNTMLSIPMLFFMITSTTAHGLPRIF